MFSTFFIDHPLIPSCPGGEFVWRRRTTVYRELNSPALFLCLGLLLCLTFLTVEAGYGQDQQAPSKNRFLRWSYQDAADWVETTDRKRLLRTAGFVAALVPLSFLDEEVSEAAKDWDSGLFGDFLDGSNEAGSLTAPLIPTGIFLVSLATDNPKFQDAAFTSLQAIIYTNVISFTVKTFIGRARPEDGKGAHHFDPFSELDASFPSGHTATAFAILSPWVFYYPHVITYGLLVIGVGAAVARLQRQKHWLTDVLAGGALGVSMAYWLSRKHQGRLSNVTIAPVVGPDTIGMTMGVTF